jgi:hypothetical protein
VQPFKDATAQRIAAELAQRLRAGDSVETKRAAHRFFGNQDAIAQRSSPGLAVGVDRHRALQRVGVWVKRKAQRTGLRQSGCDSSTILARARFQPFNR